MHVGLFGLNFFRLSSCNSRRCIVLQTVMIFCTFISLFCRSTVASNAYVCTFEWFNVWKGQPLLFVCLFVQTPNYWGEEMIGWFSLQCFPQLQSRRAKRSPKYPSLIKVLFYNSISHIQWTIKVFNHLYC